MNAARLDAIIRAMRSPEGWAGSPSEMSDAFLLLADIRDAERALRVAVDTWSLNMTAQNRSACRDAEERLRDLGVSP